MTPLASRAKWLARPTRLPESLAATRAVMRDDPAIDPRLNPEPMREFAASLVDELGRDGAVRVCRDNHWDGVLNVISPGSAIPAAAPIIRIQ